MAKSPTWQTKEGKNPKGGLNAKGRASYNAANPGKPGLKPPAPKPKDRRKMQDGRKVILRQDVRYEEEAYVCQDSQQS
jgi:hypothetical protein